MRPGIDSSKNLKEYLISDETFKEVGHYIEKETERAESSVIWKIEIEIIDIDDTNALHLLPQYAFVSQGTFTHLYSM